MTNQVLSRKTSPRTKESRYVSSELLGRVYRAIEDIRKHTGIPASQIEIAAEVGCSQASVHFALAELQERGIIKKDRAISRSIQVLKPFPRNGNK